MVKINLKDIIISQYEDLPLSQTISMFNIWKKEHEPDKRIVKTICPNCENITSPLLCTSTTELGHERDKFKSIFIERLDKIRFGTQCKKCNHKFKFMLECNSWHYPKLGTY